MFLDTPDTILAQLTKQGRGLLARKKLGDVVYRHLGWQLGSSGYDETNPVKTAPFVDPAAEAVGYLKIENNSFNLGDYIELNLKRYYYGVDWFASTSIPGTVANIVAKLSDSQAPQHFRLVTPEVDADPTRIKFTSLVSGEIGNTFPLSFHDNGPTLPNFSMVSFAGGISAALTRPSYPTPATPPTPDPLGLYLNPEGSIDATTESTVGLLVRIPEGTEGVGAYGELGVWVEVLESRWPGEAGQRVLYAWSHFPIQVKTDRHIMNQRILISY